MIRRFNVCFDAVLNIEDAVCPSVEEQVCIKAIIYKVLAMRSDETMDIDDHWVDVEGIDNVEVEAI